MMIWSQETCHEDDTVITYEDKEALIIMGRGKNRFLSPLLVYLYAIYNLFSCIKGCFYFLRMEYNVGQ